MFRSPGRVKLADDVQEQKPDREVLELRSKVLALERAKRDLEWKLERIRYEAVTYKGTLNKLLDLISKANVFEPRVKPFINFEDAGSSGAIYEGLVEDMGTVVADTGILGHVPLWELIL